MTQLAEAAEYSRLDLSRGLGSPTSVRYMTLKNLMGVFSNAGPLRNAEYSFIAIASDSTLAGNGSTW